MTIWPKYSSSPSILTRRSMASLIASSRPLCTLTTYQRLLLDLGCGGASTAAGACGLAADSAASCDASPNAGAGADSGWAVSGGAGGVTAGVTSEVETFSGMTHNSLLGKPPGRPHHHGLSSGGWVVSFCSSVGNFKTPMGGQLSTDFHITSIPNR